MISYPIKTWHCKCCGYRQDFEPTTENHDLHFNNAENFKLSDVQENECPGCAFAGERGCSLVRVADTEKMVLHNHLEQEDLDRLIKEWNDAPIEKIPTGEKIVVSDSGRQVVRDELRDETPSEREERIIRHIAAHPVPSSEQITAMRDKHEHKT